MKIIEFVVVSHCWAALPFHCKLVCWSIDFGRRYSVASARVNNRVHKYIMWRNGRVILPFIYRSHTHTDVRHFTSLNDISYLFLISLPLPFIMVYHSRVSSQWRIFSSGVEYDSSGRCVGSPYFEAMVLKLYDLRDSRREVGFTRTETPSHISHYE